MARKAWTTVVLLVAMLAASAAQAATPSAEKSAARSDELVSLHSSPIGGRTEKMYTVPANGRLRIVKACVEHTAMEIEVGDDGDRVTYGARGCTDFSPGLVVAAGETIYCDNDSGQERACALVGVFEPAAPFELKNGKRARFTDLR